MSTIPTILDIQEAVARRFGVTVRDLLSARRARSVARPRQVAMWIARHVTTHSLPEIGRAFGDRDHTTVMHAVWRIGRLMEERADFDAAVWRLLKEIDCAEMVAVRRSAMRLVA